MRILFTGASSAVGKHVLTRLLASAPEAEFWCVRHRQDVSIEDPHVRVIDLDLSGDVNAEWLPEALDLVIHFAGVTHAYDPTSYWKVNFHGTMQLAERAHARGCRRFVYISTRCATAGSGDYGESKLAAENKLRKIPWDDLLIIRPSEIYGAHGSEGVDRLIGVAQRWHLTPRLFGNSNISFAPLHVEDFADIVAHETAQPPSGVRVIDVCGPEDLSGGELTTRIAKRYRALPVPLWWPLLAFVLRIGASLKLPVGVPDQLQRLTSLKTSSARHANTVGSKRFLVSE